MNVEHISIGTLGLIAIREIINIFRDNYRKNLEAIQANTMAIVELKCEIKNLNEKIEQLPKLKQDVDAAHERIRELQAEH